MGGHSYPEQYPRPAIIVAEGVVSRAVKARLHNEGQRWSATPCLLSNEEYESIKIKFAPSVTDDHVLMFIGVVFSKEEPLTHFMLTRQGFKLALGGYRDKRTILIAELPNCTHGFTAPYKAPAYQAALEAVKALVTLQVVKYRLSSAGDRWPVGEGANLIYGELYRTIQRLGEFSYVRVQNVIDFIHEAIPELRAEWEAADLHLEPVYNVYGHSKPFVTLRLARTTSPA